MGLSTIQRGLPRRRMPSGHGFQVKRLTHLKLSPFGRGWKRFRGGLVFKAHRLVYHLTLGLRVIKKNKKKVGVGACLGGVGVLDGDSQRMQPSTLNPQPSTLNPQPSTLNPKVGACLGGVGVLDGDSQRMCRADEAVRTLDLPPHIRQSRYKTVI